ADSTVHLLKQSRTLSFADRVAYQRAVEEVYWRHRIWPNENRRTKPPLASVMSETAIENKVKDYLRNSELLEQYWQRPITPEQLQAEMDRMARHTKQPDVLREIFAALGNDPGVIAECVARSALAERLVDSLYAHDSRFHGELKRRAQEELTRRGVEELKQTSATYSEVEWVKSDNVDVASGEKIIGQPRTASALPDKPAGGAPPLQQQNAPGAITLTASEWDANVQNLANIFEQAAYIKPPKLRLGSPDGGIAAVESAAKSAHGKAADVSEALPTGKLSALQENDTSYYATAVLRKSKDRVKIATAVWPKQPIDSWRHNAQLILPITMAAKLPA